MDSEGNASLTVTSLPAGAEGGSALSVRAVYHPASLVDEGVENAREETAPSVSAAALVERNASGVPDFTITANPSSISAAQGQAATTALTVTPLNGFSEQVTLSCSNLPAQVTCAFSPVIETTANGAFTSALQVQTQAASGAVGAPDFGLGRGEHRALAWVLPGALALAGIASLRRRALRGLSGGGIAGVALLLIAAGLGLGGCSERYGYNHHPPSVATGTLVGTYALNIAASGNGGSAVTSHNIKLTLQVK